MPRKAKSSSADTHSEAVEAVIAKIPATPGAEGAPGADSQFDPISLLKERLDLQRQLRQPLSLPVTV